MLCGSASAVAGGISPCAARRGGGLGLKMWREIYWCGCAAGAWRRLNNAAKSQPRDHKDKIRETIKLGR